MGPPHVNAGIVFYPENFATSSPFALESSATVVWGSNKNIGLLVAQEILSQAEDVKEKTLAIRGSTEVSTL